MAMPDLFWLALVTLALWLLLGGWWAIGVSSMAKLGRVTVPEPATWPRVAIVVPARNEAPGVADAMETLLELDYPSYEIVAIDDRSEDDTGAILARLAARDDRLRVLAVEELPDGWLGKTHAMQLGADATSTPWILFTDADVRFRPNALREAVAYACHRERDHLAVLPRFVASGPWVGAFMGAFALLFSIYTRLWDADDPESDAAVGIGAFGLVRRAAYELAGEHAAVRMRPDDDLALGRTLKASGASQEAVFAGDRVSVAWYPDLASAVRGMRKNAFAGFGYSVPLAFGVVFALVATNVWPYLAVLVTSGATRWVYVAVLAVIFAVYAYNRHFTDHAPAYALLHPVGVLALCWAAVASAVHTLRAGGIEWRGTHYSLAELRRSEHREPGASEASSPRERQEADRD